MSKLVVTRRLRTLTMKTRGNRRSTSFSTTLASFYFLHSSRLFHRLRLLYPTSDLSRFQKDQVKHAEKCRKIDEKNNKPCGHCRGKGTRRHATKVPFYPRPISHIARRMSGWSVLVPNPIIWENGNALRNTPALQKPLTPQKSLPLGACPTINSRWKVC